MTDKPNDTPNADTRMGHLESEMRGLREVVTTLETGHENRAKRVEPRSFPHSSPTSKSLKERIRKTRKKVKKLAR